MQTGLRCMLMRGGTSKGAYFLAEDLPAEPTQRNQILLAALGSPDPRQIDGVGGAHPLTSKVAIVSRSTERFRCCDVRYRNQCSQRERGSCDAKWFPGWNGASTHREYRLEV